MTRYVYKCPERVVFYRIRDNYSLNSVNSVKFQMKRLNDETTLDRYGVPVIPSKFKF